MNTADRLKLLVVEDESSSREALRALLEDEGYEVLLASDGVEALRHLADGLAVIITDLKMPRVDGMELLRSVREHSPHTPLIVTTGRGSEKAAVEALKAGAFHYLTKPVDPEALIHHIRQAIEKHQMANQIARLHEELQRRGGFGSMIGRSDSMRKVFEQIRMVADTRSTVLVEGESGTGKELVARALHYNSPRRNRPFVAVNCAALPESLIESELFGHAKGAFTGATEKRVGKFSAAEGGTLLIDEIAEMHLDLQSKLLRAIEERVISPLGSNEEKPTDVRIVASTHQHLEDLVRAGNFREDLFYRLNVVRIVLPPLRERREDIPLLIRRFITDLAEENNRPANDITPEALGVLQSYDWPGNVRELRNTIERMIVMSSRATLDVVDLPDRLRDTVFRPPLQALIDMGMPMAEIEKEVIRQTLQRTGGNRTEASRILGLSTRTLQRRIKQYGLAI